MQKDAELLGLHHVAFRIFFPFTPKILCIFWMCQLRSSEGMQVRVQFAKCAKPSVC